MGEAKPMGEVCLDGEKNDRMAFQSGADYQNHDIRWRQRGYSSLDGGTVVHFPRSWTSSGECRLRRSFASLTEQLHTLRLENDF